ncbi:MAG: hypothetical protein A2Y79_09600 [Deltaproteobacteria bacterium RBG_13_43_22]|nr:MAG: hypothetical protein A2Y79_09600 [Deltaproteobacteria bacterium RBG_13_43_22]
MSRFSLNLLGVFLFCLFFTVEAYAAADCNFQTVTDVNFGSYDVLSGLNNDSTGSLTVSCSGQTWTTVTTSIGASPNSGGFNPRQMLQASGTDLLNYNLYTNSTRTTIWGDGTQGTSTVTTSIHKNHPWNGTIYGRIPPGLNVGIGTYSEALVVTINF